jgi:sortase (surface protein transpeptidase)
MPRFLGKRLVLRHRRLWPAVPLVVGVATAVLVAAVAGALRSAPNDPPAGHRLSPAALTDERAGTAAHRSERRRQTRLRRVNIVDAQAPPPRRIAIPAIGVSARIMALGLRPDHTMQTPRDFAATGWYEPGVEPGERGAAVIVGHVDSLRGPAVFYRLRELRRGDLIRIARVDGSVVRFRVEGLERWPKAAFPTRRVFRRTRVSALRLVTCSGRFDATTGHYVDNTIVYAARVQVRRRVPA